MKTDNFEIERLKRYYSCILKDSQRTTFVSNLGDYIFRGRELTEEDFGKDIRPIKISELSYPISNPNFKFPIGRCNRENESRFYGSSSIKPISFELGIESEKLFFLGVWKIKKKFSVQHIGFHKSIIKKDCEKFMNTISNNKLEKELCRKFTGGEECYPHSVALSEILLSCHSNLNVGGIIYPSKAFDFSEINVCLLPHIAEECLEFVECAVVKCIKTNKNDEDKSHSFHNLFIGKPIDGENINFSKFSECQDSVIRSVIVEEKLDPRDFNKQS